MKKLVLLVAIFSLVAVVPASAQLTAGEFGIAASFGTQYDMASVLYSVSPKLDLHLGFGYTSESINYPGTIPDPDATTNLGIMAGIRYFLKEGDVSPYLGAMVNYSKPSKVETSSMKTEESTIGFEVIFGGQAWLSKHVGIFSHIGVGYNMNTKTETPTGEASQDTKISTLSLFTAAVGAAFYL